MIKKIIRDNFYLIIQYAGSSLIPLLLIPHIIKEVGLVNYGILAVLMSLGGFMSVLVQYAFNYLGPVELSKGNEFFYIDTLLLKLAIFIVIGNIFTIYIYQCHYEYLKQWFLVILVPLSMAINSSWYLQYKEKFLLVTITSIIGTVFGLYLGMTQIQPEKKGLSVAIISLVTPQLILGVGTLMYSLYVIDIKQCRFQLSIKKIIDCLLEGKDVFISQLIASTYGLMGPILISVLYNTENAGVYSAVEKIINSIMAVLLLTNVAAYPKLVKLYGFKIHEYINSVKILIKIYFFMACLIAISFFIYKENILFYFYGSQSIHLYKVFYLGMILIFFGVFGPLLTGYLIMSNQGSYTLKITMLVALITLTVGIPLTYAYGALGWMFALIIGQTPLPFILWIKLKNET